MPVKLEWHAELPVLCATYSGALSLKEYHNMCKNRRAMLDKAQGPVVLVADTRDLEAFDDANRVEAHENILAHPLISRLIVVFRSQLYRTATRIMSDPTADQYPVWFFDDADQALDRAEALARLAD